MPLCTCGHEQHEHAGSPAVVDCTRCDCVAYTARPGYARTTSFADLPVSQGARDLYERLDDRKWCGDTYGLGRDESLDILAAADEKDVRNLLWARRVGRL